MSQQSTLGADGPIAEDLAAGQRQISIAEFFEKNKHMLGFDSPARALVTAVKEAVDNALDACEEAGIKPDLYVEITESGDYYRLVVEDNGPGITKEQLPKVFGKLLYGSRFHKREQARGQQGIGISAAVLYSQLTSGKPAKITSRTQGGADAQHFELIIDTDDNEPEIRADEQTTWDRPHGTRIEIEMEANLRSRNSLHDYIAQTAVVNPHARIEFDEPRLDDPLKFERVEGAELPAETEEIRPHPHGVELGTLLKMLEATDSYSLSGFMQGEFTRVGAKTSESVIENFMDRHAGREMAWRPPKSHDDRDVRAAVQGAVSNKGRDATREFAAMVADRIDDYDRIAHHEVADVVDVASDRIEEEHGVTFGSTVRENAISAAWNQVRGDPAEGSDAVREALTPDCYELVDEATSTRKDDATIQGMAERLAERFASLDGQRHRLTRDALADAVERAADATEEYDDATIGETARENLIESFWAVMRTAPDDPPSVSNVGDDRDAASDFLEAMRETDIIAPPTDCLAPITEDLVASGLRKEFDADFYASSTRDAAVHGGDPFIVEAGIAYGGELEEEGSVDVLRFANRVPLVYQRGACATSDVLKDINWRNYNLDQPGGSGIPDGPAVIVIHVASTNVPFTSESKDAVANVPEIETEIERALREVGRELKSFVNKRQSMQERRRKRDKLATILPDMARKVSEVTERPQLDIDDSLARIMNNVLVERRRENGTVQLVVENNSSANAELDVTEIVSVEPSGANGASVVEMDGEWFLQWEPSVESGGEAVLEYEVGEDADFDVSVEGIESAKLTIDA